MPGDLKETPPAAPERWRRPIAALWFANFIAATGMLAMIPFLTFFVEELGVESREAGVRWAGILVGAAPLCAALMGPVWGSVGDRFGRRSMVVRALLGIVVFVGLMSFADSLALMLVLRALQGCFSGYVAPSLTLASVIGPPDRQAWIASRIQSAVPAGAIAGYLLGGHVADLGSVRLIFPICAGLAVVAAAVVLATVPEPELPPAATGRGLRRILAGIAADYRYVFELPALLRFLVLLVLVRILVSLVDPNLARFVRDDLGGDPADAGLVLAAESLMLLVFMPIWGRRSDRIGHRRTFSLCATGVALAYAAQSVARSVPALLAARVVNGVFLAGIFPAGYGLAARESSVHRRGSAMGVVFLCIALSHSAGSMLGGDAVRLLGFRPVMAAVAALILVLASLGLLESWRARRRRRFEQA